MAREVKLPQLGQTMEEGTIVNVLIKQGDEVKKGDVLFEVETDKATLEMESPAAGFVKGILVKVDDTVPVNETVLVLGEKDEEVDLGAYASAGSQGAAQAKGEAASSAAPAAASGGLAASTGSVAIPDNVKVINLPQLGQTMEEGTIVNLVAKVGDKVAKGDVLMEVETDKATLEMESSAQGVLKAFLAEEGQTLPVNAPVAIIADEGVDVSQEVIDSLKSGGAEGATSQGPAAATAEPAQNSHAAAQQPSAAPAGEVKAPASAKVVRLPQLGQTMEEGTIVNVVLKEGDKIGKGDVLFEIETDKATLEMESPAEGFVKEILVESGETVPVNYPVAILGDEHEEIPQEYIEYLKAGATGQAQTPAQQAPSAAAPASVAPTTQPGAGAQVPAAAAGRVFASPRARTVAKELGIDIAMVAPAAGSLRITEADVRKAAAGGTAAAQQAQIAVELPQPAYNLGEKVKMSRMQKLVGQRMLESKRNIPCFYLNIVADVTEMFSLRSKLNKSGSVKISFNDFIIRAVAMGLKHYPVMTGQLDGDHIRLADTIDVGLAISVEDGLVAPLSRDADKKSLAEIATYNKALIERAKTNKLGPDDVTGGSTTVSNLGGFGIDSFIPIVVPGQCSILGVGKITDTCVPIDGNIMVRKLMNLNLSVDHKVANGADAAQYLDFVKKLLENPQSLL